jgi:hypothetical protein
MALITNSELQRVLAAQPVARMQRIAAMWGWHGLRLWSVRDSQVAGGAILWYMTPDEKFNLQINQHPIGQSRTYRATVKAERYEIVNTGWHDFELFDDDAALVAEADRLHCWLDRRRLKDRVLRTRFLAEHPEVQVYPETKKRGRLRLRMANAYQSTSIRSASGNASRNAQ